MTKFDMCRLSSALQQARILRTGKIEQIQNGYEVVRLFNKHIKTLFPWVSLARQDSRISEKTQFLYRLLIYL
jgi:hypothetical protein